MKKTVLTLTVFAFAFATVFTSCGGKDTNVTGVTLSSTTLSMEIGESATLTAVVAPSDATDKSVTWISSNVAVAVVDNNGKVTAITAGTTVVTVTTKDGGHAATCAITVESGEPTVTVKFGSVQWTASAIEATEYSASSVIDFWAAKTTLGAFPFVNFVIPNAVGTINYVTDDAIDYYEKTLFSDGETFMYGDWWAVSGTATITHYSGGKLSGSVKVTMYDAVAFTDGDPNPEERVLEVTFKNINVKNSTKMIKNIDRKR